MGVLGSRAENQATKLFNTTTWGHKRSRGGFTKTSVTIIGVHIEVRWVHWSQRWFLTENLEGNSNSEPSEGSSLTLRVCEKVNGFTKKLFTIIGVHIEVRSHIEELLAVRKF